jgi:adenylate cyclase class IV
MSSHSQLEIERKFFFDSNFEERLNHVGAVLIKTTNLIDEYYDNELTNFLTLNDCWLRLRNSKWELKYPYEFKSKNKEIQNYIELSNDSEIFDYIINLSKPYILDENLINESSMEFLIKKLKLTPFSKIKSIRKTYQIDNDIKIDLDITDFDYQLGEIEVILDKNKSTQEDLEKSIEKINQTAHNLGINHFIY